jgi:hypothetical protein
MNIRTHVIDDGIPEFMRRQKAPVAVREAA